MNASERFNDLQRQGFMKFRAPKAPKKVRQTVACDACLNWHPEGKHTADAATRKANHAAAELQRQAAHARAVFGA